MIDWYSLLLAFLGGCTAAAGLLVGAGAFYGLARHSVGMLNVFLDEDLDEDARHARVVRRIGPLIGSLLLFVLYLAAIVALAWGPVLLYEWLSGASYDFASTDPWLFWTAFSLGTFPPFLLFAYRNRQVDYSPLDRLFHRLSLDHPALGRSLFRLESRRLPAATVRQPFLIVSGLARAGTTALTKLLDERGEFRSLRYGNMPFLLSPKLWGKIHRPDSGTTRERSHGDGVTFGHDSVEALEEYFWRTFLRDDFIHEKYLSEHEVSEKIYEQYLRYQSLVGGEGGGMYLAKNNNFLLRYAAVRRHDPDFHFICLFRHPLVQARSLQTIHERFSAQQEENPFMLEYMNWLVHHEFGKNHKPFRFSTDTTDPGEDAGARNGWLRAWYRYYRRALDFSTDDHFHLIPHERLARDPAAVLTTISRQTGIPINTTGLTPHPTTVPTPPDDVDAVLLQDCLALYDTLSAQSEQALNR